MRNQHLELLQQVQQQAGVDISDLLDPGLGHLTLRSCTPHC